MISSDLQFKFQQILPCQQVNVFVYFQQEIPLLLGNIFNVQYLHIYAFFDFEIAVLVEVLERKQDNAVYKEIPDENEMNNENFAKQGQLKLHRNLKYMFGENFISTKYFYNFKVLLLYFWTCMGSLVVWILFYTPG